MVDEVGSGGAVEISLVAPSSTRVVVQDLGGELLELVGSQLEACLLSLLSQSSGSQGLLLAEAAGQLQARLALVWSKHDGAGRVSSAFSAGDMVRFFQNQESL